MIPANEIAESLGEKRLLNMVMVGAMLQMLPVLTYDMVAQALDDHMPDRHKQLLGKNLEALKEGMNFASEKFAEHQPAA